MDTDLVPTVAPSSRHHRNGRRRQPSTGGLAGLVTTGSVVSRERIRQFKGPVSGSWRVGTNERSAHFQTRLAAPMVVRKSARTTRPRRGTANSGPATTPDVWSQDEDDRLREGVAQLGPKRWRAIVEAFFSDGSRSADECYARWVELTRHGQSAEKRKWSAQEDRQLHELVRRYNQENWSLVASQLRGRNAKQCRERWQNQIRPDLKRDGWTQEEDATIVRLQTELGNKWATIARELPGRTDNMVKNRWYSTLVREVQQPRQARAPAKPKTAIKPKAPPIVVELQSFRQPQRQQVSDETIMRPKAKRKRQKLFGTTSKRKKKKQRVQEVPADAPGQSPDTVDAVADQEHPGNPWVSAIPVFEDAAESVEGSLDDEDAHTRFLLEETDPLMEPIQRQDPEEEGDGAVEDWLPGEVCLGRDSLLALAAEQLPSLGVAEEDEDDLLAGLDVGRVVAVVHDAWSGDVLV